MKLDNIDKKILKRQLKAVDLNSYILIGDIKIIPYNELFIIEYNGSNLVILATNDVIDYLTNCIN